MAKKPRKKPPTREKVASIWVDTASLLIGDPCQTLRSKRDKSKVPTYEDLLKARFPESEHPLPDLEKLLKEGKTAEEIWKVWKESRPVYQETVVFQNNHGTVGAVCLNVGNDGYYPVYLERNNKGEPRRIIIELGGKVKP